MIFKKLDVFMQIAIPAIAVAYFVYGDYNLNGFIIGVFIFFAGLAIWQLFSALVHVFYSKGALLPKTRGVYHLLLLVAIPVCLSCMIPDITPNIYYAIILVGGGMAGFYFIITIKEYKMMKKKSAQLHLEETQTTQGNE